MKLNVYGKKFFNLSFFNRSFRLKGALGIFIFLFIAWAAPFLVCLKINNTVKNTLKSMGWYNGDLTINRCSWSGATLSGLKFYNKEMVIYISDIHFSPFNWIFQGANPAEISIDRVQIETTGLTALPPLLSFSANKTLEKTPFITSVKIKNIDLILKNSFTPSDFPLVFQGHGQGHRVKSKTEFPAQIGDFIFDIQWFSKQQPKFRAYSSLYLSPSYGKIETTGEHYTHPVLGKKAALSWFKKTFTRASESVATHGHLEGELEFLTANSIEEEKKQGALQLTADFDIYSRDYEGQLAILENKVPLLDIKGAFNHTGKGWATVDMPAFDWKAWNFPLTEIIPEKHIHYQGGKIGGKGHLLIDKGAITPQGAFDVFLKNATFLSPAAHYKNINGVISLTNFHPLTFKDQQSVTIEHVILDETPFKDVHLSFNGASPSTLMISRISGIFLGGTFYFHDFKPSLDENNVVFQGVFRHIKLNEGCHTLGLKTLTAQGELSGQGIFSWKDGHFQVKEADFSLNSSEANLKMNLPPESAPLIPLKNDNASATPSSTVAFEALKNLRCTLVNLRVASEKQGEISSKNNIYLKIIGFNPQVLNGYPFEYIIQTTGCIRDVIRNFKDQDRLREQKNNQKPCGVSLPN